MQTATEHLGFIRFCCLNSRTWNRIIAPRPLLLELGPFLLAPPDRLRSGWEESQPGLLSERLMIVTQ